VLVEHQSTLASGPSTRNEGWLHRGTYHAASIKSRVNAIQVARRCIYGHEQLRRFCSEAVEDGDRRPLVMIGDTGNVDEVVSRWTEAEVQFRPIRRETAQKLVPDANFSRAAAIFEASDVSLNTRLLCRKLFALARKSGCDFYIGNQVERFDGQIATIHAEDGAKLRIEARKFVYSAGTGTKSLFRKFHDIELAIRFWKSHLVITRRLAPVGVFFVDPHEGAMMHHGGVSIVGLNEDALLSPEPNYDVIEERALNVRKAIARIFPSWNQTDAIVAMPVRSISP
jgi:glycine/D-amino acid oxidase-like deaminating enzyme